RQKIEAEGIGFYAVRPDLTDFGDPKELMRQALDLLKGPEVVIRQLMLPHLRASYDDLTAAARGADILVTHTLTYARPLVAEKQGVKWVSTALQPVSFFSVYDPPVLAPAPLLTKLRPLGPALYRPLFALMKRTLRDWMEPVHRLRAEIGLPPATANPMFEG